jgi:hypothetical protein
MIRVCPGLGSKQQRNMGRLALEAAIAYVLRDPEESLAVRSEGEPMRGIYDPVSGSREVWHRY